MKLLVDMNLSVLWVGVLQEAGHQAQHWSAIGAFDAPDREILAFAIAEQAVVLTADLDFGRLLLETNGSGPSVIQLRSAGLLPRQAAERVLPQLETMEAAVAEGRLVTIRENGTRIRLLPLSGTPETPIDVSTGR